jgi:ketosteroid isomerase-like protein
MTINVQANAAKWDDVFNRGDTTGLGEFYASDALVIPAGGTPVTGPAAISQFFDGLRSKGFAGHKIVVDSVIEKGDTVIASGKWQLNGPGEDGETKQYGGNWVNVLGRNGEDWRILLHTWN